MGANSANSAYQNQYDTTKLAIAELEKPVCQKAIKDAPKEFPKWVSYEPNPCFALSIKYDFAKNLHDSKKKSGQITSVDLLEEFEDTWGNYRLKQGAIEGLIGLFAYWLLLALAGLSFLICRWVYRGFKN